MLQNTFSLIMHCKSSAEGEPTTKWLNVMYGFLYNAANINLQGLNLVDRGSVCRGKVVGCLAFRQGYIRRTIYRLIWYILLNLA